MTPRGKAPDLHEGASNNTSQERQPNLPSSLTAGSARRLGAVHVSDVEQPETGPPRLALVNVGKRWGRNKPPILDGIDATLPGGAVAAIVGKNGVGKTTLLRITAGLIHPNEGYVELDGLHPIRDRRIYQRRLGFVPAGQTGLYARLSVAFHLGFCARIMLIPAASRAEAIAAATERFELQELLRQRVDRLSMGQRQRVRLALGFLHRPTLLLLDEPRNSLDEDSAALLNRAIEAFAAEGGTVLWCAPSVDDVTVPVDLTYELVAGRMERR